MSHLDKRARPRRPRPVGQAVSSRCVFYLASAYRSGRSGALDSYQTSPRTSNPRISTGPFPSSRNRRRCPTRSIGTTCGTLSNPISRVVKFLSTDISSSLVRSCSLLRLLPLRLLVPYLLGVAVRGFRSPLSCLAVASAWRLPLGSRSRRFPIGTNRLDRRRSR